MSEDRGLKVAGGMKRSEHWPKVEESFKKSNPHCAACGPCAEANVHHRYPFHLVILAGRPDLELDPRNLITLCVDPAKDHHLMCGHLGEFVSFNTDVEPDSKKLSGMSKAAIEADSYWVAKKDARPTGHFKDDAEKAAFLASLNSVFGESPKVDLTGRPI